jgi:UDP-N-acetylmuramoyl-L-alanyl-D-glutamate--2,6-diaminopimelate ligase
VGQRRNFADLWKAADLDVSPLDDLYISGIFDNSQRVEPEGVFVATRGTTTDSHLFISDAVERGAKVLIVEQDIPAYRNTHVIRVSNSRDVLGKLAHAYYGNPSRDMLVAGISGTNGKTTSTFLMEAIFQAAGLKPGIIGTIEHRYGDVHVKAHNTTPTALQIAELMAQMRDAGVNAIAMEVSSHAADQDRISGIKFDVGLLTNITQDHLDYHKTMEAYALAKKRFYFDHLLRNPAGYTRAIPPAAVFNFDDSRARQFAEEFPEKKLTFGFDEGADIRALAVDYRLDGTLIEVDNQGDVLDIDTRLLGGFNVMNVLGAFATGLACGFPLETVLRGISQVSAVSGRFEQVSEGQDFRIIVDYAHTPDALERILVNARRLTNQRIITVFGCGGDRDPTKRPIMGHTAAELSDYVIVTNDNPRTESPEAIAEMIEEGIREVDMSDKGFSVQLDRRAAIGEAIGLAREGDLVLIAGKGHEDYQITSSGTIHFDDREVAREFLMEMKKS